MDDEKSIAEKLTHAITRAADSVKSTMSNIVETASVAAQHAMESNAERISGQPATQLDPGLMVATANKQASIPPATDAAAMPVPLVADQPVAKKKSRAKTNSSKTPAAPKKAAVTKSTRKIGKKSAKTPAGKKAAKKVVKKSTGKAKKSKR
jgi:hypothetical protein